jgi:serine/threonine-protein kinase HipA
MFHCEPFEPCQIRRELLISVANRLPDELNAVRLLAREQGLTNAIVERLATQLIARAGNCGRLLGAA